MSATLTAVRDHVMRPGESAPSDELACGMSALSAIERAVLAFRREGHDDVADALTLLHLDVARVLSRHREASGE